MAGHISAVMLAGTILPTPFQEALGMPALCLPMGRSGVILHAWRDLYASVDGLDLIELVVRSPEELSSVEALVRSSGPNASAEPDVAVRRDPGAWRGVAGLLHDVTRPLDDDALVFVSEAHCQPPGSLQPLMDALDEDVFGVVGTTKHDEPAGVYLFRRSAFDDVPTIGYCDLKEQLLPQLYAAGRKVVAAAVSPTVHRVRDLESYLEAARRSLDNGSDSAPTRVSPQASVSGSAILEGFCIIEPGAVVEDGAVLHESVVLSGATVGGGAVVSRSVIGPKVTVEPRQRVVRDVVAAPKAAAGVAALEDEPAPAVHGNGRRRSSAAAPQTTSALPRAGGQQ